MSDMPNHHKMWHPSTTRKMVRMFQEGKSWNEIGAALGRSPGGCYMRFKHVRSYTLYLMRKKAGIEPAWRTSVPEDNEVFFAEYFKGKEPST